MKTHQLPCTRKVNLCLEKIRPPHLNKFQPPGKIWVQTEAVLGQCTSTVSSVATGGQNLKGGGRRGIAWLCPAAHAGFLRPRPFRPGATPSCCRTAQRPYLTRRSACFSLLSSLVFKSVEVLASLIHGWNWLVASLFPTVSAPASFPGLCRFSGRSCFPLTGDALAWCWEQVGLLLFSPHIPPKMYKGFLTHSTPWGSRDHPLS